MCVWAINMAVSVRQRWMWWAFWDQITVREREREGEAERYVLLES